MTNILDQPAISGLVDAPEKLVVTMKVGPPGYYSIGIDVPAGSFDGSFEYIRAHLYEQLQAEVEQLKEALAAAEYDWNADPDNLVPLPPEESND